MMNQCHQIGFHCYGSNWTLFFAEIKPLLLHIFQWCGVILQNEMFSSLSEDMSCNELRFIQQFQSESNEQQKETNNNSINTYTNNTFKQLLIIFINILMKKCMKNY